MTEKWEYVISEITCIFGTSFQNHFRNTYHLGYTTDTSILRLFEDVLNFFKFMQILHHIFNPPCVLLPCLLVCQASG